MLAGLGETTHPSCTCNVCGLDGGKVGIGTRGFCMPHEPPAGHVTEPDQPVDTLSTVDGIAILPTLATRARDVAREARR